MSLYTDDNSLVQPSVPAQTDDHNPLEALGKALTLPAESASQAQALAAAIERFEVEPTKIPEIAAQLLPMIVSGGESLLRTWTLDLVLLAVGRADLRFEVKVAVAQSSLPTLVQLLHPQVPNAKTTRQLIPIFSTIYPLLFRAWATTRSQPDPQIVQALQVSKHTILSIVKAPKGLGVPRGVMAVAWKFVQRILLIGTRNGGADPRLQNKSDPNVNLWPASNTTLNPAELEQEATTLRETLVRSLFTYDDPALLHPLFNMIPPLAKARPSLAPLLVSSVTQWTPVALEGAGRPPSQIRAVEKTVKVVMVHLTRFAPLSAFASQLAEGIANQRKRLEAADLVARRTQRPGAQTRKRELSPPPMQHAETSAAGAKRMKMEDAPPAGVGTGSGKGVEFDISEFAPEVVIDLVMRNFEALRPDIIERAFAHARKAIETNSPDAMPVLAASLGFAVPGAQAAFATFGADEGPDDMLMDGVGHGHAVKSEAKAEIKEEEAMNPLDMDSDDEEDEEFGDLDLEAYADLANAEASASAVAFADFQLPPPQLPKPEQRDEMVETAITRIWQSGADLASGISSLAVESTNPGVTSAVKPRELWMLLVSRLATRGKMPKESAEGLERLQQMTCDYIVADFAKRSKFASVWLNEEWFNSKMAGLVSPVYSTALDLIIKAYVGQIDNKDKTLSAFLIGLPEIPEAVMTQLSSLCVDPERMVTGFTVLRELTEARPPIRDACLKITLTLTTHPDRRIRVAAIATVRRWVPDVEPMNSKVTEFAKGLLARFSNVKPAPPVAKVETEKVEEVVKAEVKAEEGEGAAAEATKVEKEPTPEPEVALGTDMSPYLPTELVAPVPEATVQQHLELLFALCKRQPEFLHDIFNAYPTLEPSVQESIGTLLAPLITSMGSSHPKLLEILRSFPPGADRLALRILTVLTDTKRKIDPSLVTMVTDLMAERELDPRFIIPILGELEKAEVMKQLPRLVSLLCGSNSERDLVRKVFRSVVTIPDAITLSSNQPRAAKSDMLTPADLLVLLLQEEKAIGIKATIEAIGICFSMTEIFKSEVLAVVMQRVVDAPELPVVFLRTVIQAVSTYRSLVGFVANTILPRLIAKKVWLNDKYWSGFSILSKVIAPASFGALLQLPKDQIKDLVDKQPGLKPGLRAFMASKPGMAKAQALTEIFGEPEPAVKPEDTASSSSSPSQSVMVN